MVEVTRPSHGAKGNGLTNDTDPLPKAIHENTGRHKTLFFPKGIHLGNRTLKWPKKWEVPAGTQNQPRVGRIDQVIPDDRAYLFEVASSELHMAVVFEKVNDKHARATSAPPMERLKNAVIVFVVSSWYDYLRNVVAPKTKLFGPLL